MTDIISVPARRLRELWLSRGPALPALAAPHVPQPPMLSSSPVWSCYSLPIATSREADAVLAEFGLAAAHHRVLHFVNRNPGLKVQDLLDILKITKQSLVARPEAPGRSRLDLPDCRQRGSPPAAARTRRTKARRLAAQPRYREAKRIGNAPCGGGQPAAKRRCCASFLP